MLRGKIRLRTSDMWDIVLLPYERWPLLLRTEVDKSATGRGYERMLVNGRVAGTTPSLSVYISHVSSYCYCIVARHFPISSAPPVRFIVRHRREVVHTEFAMVCRDFRTCTRLCSIRRGFIYFCKFRYSYIITVIIYEKRILLLQNPRLKRNKNRNNERSIKNIRKILFFPLASRVLTEKLSPWLPIHDSNPWVLSDSGERRDCASVFSAQRQTLHFAIRIISCNAERGDPPSIREGYAR